MLAMKHFVREKKVNMGRGSDSSRADDDEMILVSGDVMEKRTSGVRRGHTRDDTYAVRLFFFFFTTLRMHPSMSFFSDTRSERIKSY